MSDDIVARVLRDGTLEVEGRLVDASNTTLRATASLDGIDIACVYKPRRGERPLWDFPDGTLGLREVATYETSVLLGWDCVPTTVWRDSGPLGAGMCQQWIEVVDDPVVDLVPLGATPAGWHAIVDAEDYSGQKVTLVHADLPGLRRLALLDLVVNNTDRKGGHILVDARGAIRGIDHGVCFHSEDKIRTVLWGWIGQPIADDDLDTLQALRARMLECALDDWISQGEVRAAIARIDRLCMEGVYPSPSGSWPPLPWPAF